MKLVFFLIVAAIIFLLFKADAVPSYEGYKTLIKENEPLMRITVMIFSSVVTVLAMVVALFKEDIRGFFVRPKLSVGKDNKLNEEKQKVDGQNTIEALYYYYKVFISNMGNIPAKEVEVHLTSLRYKKGSEQSHREIEIDVVPLLWKTSDSDSGQIIIPRNSKKSLTLFKLLPPSQTSTPDQPLPSTPNSTRIQIGKNEYCVDKEPGEWFIVFSIYSDNAKPLDIEITISWNGKWEPRLSEMSTHLQLQEEIKNV